MIKLLKNACYGVLGFLIIVGLLLAWLLTTPSGLQMLIRIGSIYLPGSLKVHRVSGTALRQFSVDALSYTHDKTNVLIKDLQVNGDFISLLKLKVSTYKATWHSVQWQQESQTLFKSIEGLLDVSGTPTLWHARLKSKINRTATEQWEFVSNVDGHAAWHWNFDAKAVRVKESAATEEGLYANLSSKGIITAPDKGIMTVTLSPGHYDMPDSKSIPSLNFQGGTLQFNLTSKAFTGTGSIAIDKNKKIDLDFTLPQYNMTKGLEDSQPINANLTLLIQSFEFLKPLSSEISNPEGELIANLHAFGTWGKKIIQSSITLKNGRVAIPELGLKLEAMQCEIRAEKQHWNAKGSIHSNNKKIQLKGDGLLTPSVMGNLKITGSDFPIVNTKDFKVSISPDITIAGNNKGLKIEGMITVPFAEIQPQSFTNSLSLSDDVVLKTQNQTQSTPINTTMAVKIHMGKAVSLAYRGLNAKLAGTINITQMPQSPINATGELTVKKGEYKAYGQLLTIEQGQLIFTGGRLDNPGLSLKASKKIDVTTNTTEGTNKPFDFNDNTLQTANARGNINIGVEVSGRLADPKIALFSNPAILSQADILSMLILGRPASQANKAGGQLLIAALSSMNLGGNTNSTQLLEQLKKNYGFDLNVQTTSNYNMSTNQFTDSTAVVVGKSISKKIYVSYNVGLSQNDPNVLALKYLLNKFYSIQISSSTTSNGIDFLYTSHKK